MRYKIFASIFLSAWIFALAVPVVVSAANIVQVEYNPICWEKKECADTRMQLFGASEQVAGQGWLEQEGECSKPGWGKCLPGSKTVTEISFGGQTTFTHIGDYIKTAYNYSLVMIGILAVVVIIIAGAQWITSAGNSETIGTSKKRISGAIIGLVIAYMSYNILSSINPATVNLRLPQIWMIRPQVLPGDFCRDLPEATFFASATGADDQIKEVKATGSETFDLQYPYVEIGQGSTRQEIAFFCGARLFIKGTSAETTCKGDRCVIKGMVCSNAEPVSEKMPYSCKAAMIAGQVTGLTSDFNPFTNSWEEIEGSVDLYLACGDLSGKTRGKSIQVDTEDTTLMNAAGTTESFLLRLEEENSLNDAKAECAGGVIMGGYLVINFSPNMSANFLGESHAIGNGGNDIGFFGSIGSGSGGFDAPMFFNINAFIPIASLESGVNMTINSKKVNQFMGLGSSISLGLDLIFGDKSNEQIGKEQVKKMLLPYKDYYLSETWKLFEAIWTE